MKKAILIIMSVAILGALGLYINKKPAVVASATQTSAVASNNTSASTPTSTSSSSGYKNGTFTGDAANTPYGTVRVAVVISGRKITGVKFLQMPNDQVHSQEVTAVAGPLLKQSTLQHQSAKIDFVSGATSTSIGYEQSLQAALDQAA